MSGKQPAIKIKIRPEEQLEPVWPWICPLVPMPYIPEVVTPDNKRMVEETIRELAHAVEFLDLVAIDRANNIQRKLCLVLLNESRSRLDDFLCPPIGLPSS